MDIPVVKHSFTTIYPTPYSKEDIIYDYPKGAVLMLCLLHDTNIICAYSEYQESEDYTDFSVREQYLKDYFASVPKEARPQNGTKYRIVVQSPIAKSSFSLQKAIPMSKEDFYDNYFFHIEQTYYACKERFKSECTQESFKIIFYEPSKQEHGILYLGYSIADNPDVTDMENLLNAKLTIISECEFQNRRHKYREKWRNKDNSKSGENSQNKKSVMKEIVSWIHKTDYSEFLNNIKARVKGQPQLNLVIINVYTYLNTLSKGTLYRSNMLLSAPSGSGKTETYRAIRDYFEKEIPLLPVIQIDLSAFTETGYRGRNTYELGKIIAEKKTDGIAITFLDEIDKKIMPSLSNIRSNANVAVQSELLTLIEGSVMTDSSGNYLLNSANTLFIGLGSFNEVRKQKSEKAMRNKMGFGAEENPHYDHYQDITASDIIELGSTYEFLGRFSILVNYQKLSKDHILEIIDAMVHELSEALQIEIHLSDKMLSFLLESANGEYGCRRLRSLIESAVYPKYALLLEDGKREAQLFVDEPYLQK